MSDSCKHAKMFFKEFPEVNDDDGLYCYDCEQKVQTETEKKLEIAVAALNEINLIRNFKDPAYAFTKARDISYKALLAIQGKQVGE